MTTITLIQTIDLISLTSTQGEIMDRLLNSFRSFARDEDGAQIVEYALIIAVVSLGLILLLMNGTTGINFQAWIDRVNTCLGAGPCV